MTYQEIYLATLKAIKEMGSKDLKGISWFKRNWNNTTPQKDNP